MDCGRNAVKALCKVNCASGIKCGHFRDIDPKVYGIFIPNMRPHRHGRVVSSAVTLRRPARAALRHKNSGILCPGVIFDAIAPGASNDATLGLIALATPASHPNRIASVTQQDAPGSGHRLIVTPKANTTPGARPPGARSNEERCLSLLFQQSQQRLTGRRRQLFGVDRAIVVRIGGLETLLDEREVFGLVERTILVGIRCGHGFCV